MENNFEKRPDISKFASWAIMNKPFTKEKHYLRDTSICFDVQEGETYANHVEMSGYYCSTIISYGADENGFLRRVYHAVFPSLRMYPNDTHGSFDYNFVPVSLKCNGELLEEKVVCFVFDGMLHIRTKASDLEICRSLFVAPDASAFIEKIEITNQENEAVSVCVIDNEGTQITDAKNGHNGEQYKTFVQKEDSCFALEQGRKKALYVAYCGVEKERVFVVDCQEQYMRRLRFLEDVSERFVVETPDDVINAMAHYAKIRAAESIFKTKSGLMHSPGGGNYYAALWTNDQCEYVNPLFANLGYEPGVEQSLNCYKMYQTYISPKKALVTSIIAEGDDVWNGAGDRGDSAMYAYGCGRFLLALGDKKIAEKFIGSIEECLEYTISQINEFGVVESDSDELENRFESGKANLSTSCLAYDALISATYLERDLERMDKCECFRSKAETLRVAIEKYFGTNVEGYETYKYCIEEEALRSWICLPLVVGIYDRAEETVGALLSEKLRVGEGLVSRSGEKTFWDRSTLYALRGIFYAGYGADALELLGAYSKARVLGEHIPYAVEAFPEGNQAHLSAESGLYLRIFTEGILGYRPTGLRTFELAPHLPGNWGKMQIRNIRLCGTTADVRVERKCERYHIYLRTADTVTELGMNEGEKLELQL